MVGKPRKRINPDKEIINRVLRAFHCTKTKQVASYLKVTPGAIHQYNRIGWPEYQLEEVSKLASIDLTWLKTGVGEPYKPYTHLFKKASRPSKLIDEEKKTKDPK